MRVFDHAYEQISYYTSVIKEDLRLPDGPLGRMYGQAMAIIQKDEICEVEPGWYRVWSQTHDDVWYDVRLGKKGWTCGCEYGRGGHNVCRHVLATSPEPESLHIANAALKGKHVDNNRHERQNGDQADRIKAGTRGFNSDCPGVLILHVVYYNFLRPHLGIGGITPAEKAGIHIPGPDRLLTLIRCAAAARLAFT